MQKSKIVRKTVKPKTIRKEKQGIYGIDTQCVYFRNVLNNIGIKSNKTSPKYVLPLNSNYTAEAFYETYIKYKPDVIFFIRNNHVLGGKVYLWESLKKKHGREIASTIMPETFILPRNRIQFNKKYKKGNYYILKNKKQRQLGIKLTNNYEEILAHKKDGYTLVQTMLTDPLVYKGLKFNIRIYLIVICDRKKIDAYFYNNGTITYASQPYDKTNLTFENSISSFYANKTIYEDGYPNTIGELTQNLPIPNLFQKIKKQLNMTMKAVSNDLRYNDFKVKSVQLFGADFMIDENMNAHLLEINIGPNMSAYNEKDDVVRTGMLAGIIDLIDGKIPKNYIQV